MSAEVLRRAAALMRERAEAATPGPWVVGDRWHIGGVLPERFGKGKCHACNRGAPSWVGNRDINGNRMLAHVHVDSEPWWHHNINAVRDDGPVSVVNDTDEYGYMRDADAAHIASWHPAVALAVADWLDDHAETAELFVAKEIPAAAWSMNWQTSHNRALAVARAYLRDDPQPAPGPD